MSKTADLLTKHEIRATKRCAACREPCASELRKLLDHAISTQQRVTLAQLANCIRDVANYPHGKDALSKHLSNHDPERLAKLNLGHRGTLE